MTTLTDVAEGVRQAIAAYTHALDDGRTDAVVATFCTDGRCDIPGLGSATGHEELRATYAGWKPKRAVRHVVTNTLVTEWNDHEATATATSDVTVLAQRENGWTIEVVGRYHDTLRCEDGTWRFHTRTAEFLV